jgi:hypothetical protein
MKINAQTLSAAGWSDNQIDRYYTLLDRKQTRGLAALSPEGRRFMQSARAAVEDFETQRQADLVAASKRKVSGKQPVESKLHYRWCAAEVELVGQFLELSPGEISAYQIVKDEECKALAKFQPVLDQIDTSKRFRVDQVIAEVMELALVMKGARVAQADSEGFFAAIFPLFESEWNTKWGRYEGTNRSVVFSDTEELEFRAVVRPLLEQATRAAYPSIVATV